MVISLKTIQSLQQFRDVLGNDPKIKYISGKGRKVNESYTLNQLSFRLNKIRPKNLNYEDMKIFHELKGRLKEMDMQSLDSLATGKPKCEVTFAKIRQEIGNWWFKITMCFDRKKFLNHSIVEPRTSVNQPVVVPEIMQDPLDAVVEHTKPFAKYQIPLPKQFGEGKTVGLTAFNIRPANLFFQSLFKETMIQTTLPGEGLFAFNSSGDEIRHYIDFEVANNPEKVVEVSARGKFGGVVVDGQGYAVDNLAEVYGDKVYQLTYKEIQDVLNSQKIYTSSLLPLPFYSGLKEALKKTGSPILPGSDEKPLTLRDIKDGPIKEFIDKVDKDPLIFGFKNKNLYERSKKLTLYELGSMVVKTEDYYLFTDESGKIFSREPGTKDAFRLINACGIRGLSASTTPDLMKQNIMKHAFMTALAAAENGIVIFPAVGMGVWRGAPELYWSAFLDAVVESPVQFDRIFVNPGHQKTTSGEFINSQGEEFQRFLDSYRPNLANPLHSKENLEKLKKITNLFDQKTDLLQLTHNLKQVYPEKIVSLFNASDPDVTLGWHVGATEEHYTAIGSNGLCFEDITGVHKDPERLIHVAS